MGDKEKRNAVREELEVLAPTLARLKETEKQLDVPVDYFDQLSTAVFHRIREEQPALRPEGAERRQLFWERLTSTFFYPNYALTLVGVAILVIGISILTSNNKQHGMGENAMSVEEINEYINYYLDDFDLSLLADEAAFSSLGTEILSDEDSVEENAMEDYFEELLEDINMEELL